MCTQIENLKKARANVYCFSETPQKEIASITKSAYLIYTKL